MACCALACASVSARLGDLEPSRAGLTASFWRMSLSCVDTGEAGRLRPCSSRNGKSSTTLLNLSLVGLYTSVLSILSAALLAVRLGMYGAPCLAFTVFCASAPIFQVLILVMNSTNVHAAERFLAPLGMAQARPPVRLTGCPFMPLNGWTAKLWLGANWAIMPSSQFSYRVMPTWLRMNGCCAFHPQVSAKAFSAAIPPSSFTVSTTYSSASRFVGSSNVACFRSGLTRRPPLPQAHIQKKPSWALRSKPQRAILLPCFLVSIKP